MNYVLGRHISFEVTGLQRLCQKHNAFLQGLLFLLINEAACNRDSFLPIFESMKAIVTDKYLMIEPKNVDPYQVKNLYEEAIFYYS